MRYLLAAFTCVVFALRDLPAPRVAAYRAWVPNRTIAFWAAPYFVSVAVVGAASALQGGLDGKLSSPAAVLHGLVQGLAAGAVLEVPNRNTQRSTNARLRAAADERLGQLTQQAVYARALQGLAPAEVRALLLNLLAPPQPSDPVRRKEIAHAQNLLAQTEQVITDVQLVRLRGKVVGEVLAQGLTPSQLALAAGRTPGQV